MRGKARAAVAAAAENGAASVATLATPEEAPVTHGELAALVAIMERLVERQAPAPAAPIAAAWVTLQQASELSGLSEGLLRRLVREGKLRGIRDRFVKVRRAEVEALEL